VERDTIPDVGRAASLKAAARFLFLRKDKRMYEHRDQADPRIADLRSSEQPSPLKERLDEEELAYQQGRSAFRRKEATARQLLHAVRPHDLDSMHVALYRLAGWCDEMRETLHRTHMENDGR
jgi:predicted acyl esterase